MSLLSKEQLLSLGARLAEEVVELPGVGDVLCRELTAAQRAKVVGVLTAGVQDGGAPNFARYQEMLLQLGLADPGSPAEARTPLLDMADAKKAMELGAGKIAALCSAIERLSGLDKNAQQRAEGNSAPTQSSTGTSE